MKRVVYRRNKLTRSQKIKNGLKQIRKSVADFKSKIYRTYLFWKLSSAFNNWPEDIKVPLPIAVIENE